MTIHSSVMLGGGDVQSDKNSFASQFELEGEEQVRQKIAQGAYNSAYAYQVATEWLEQKSRAHAVRARETSLLSERQARSAEVSNQLGERQVQLAESTNRLAMKANRLSKWAILISIASCILATVAILYHHS